MPTMGFTPNNAPLPWERDDADEETVDYAKLRKEMIELRSVEVREAMDQYNREYRRL